MSELSILKEAFSTGVAPAGTEIKRFQILLKKFGSIANPQFVHLYPVRDCRYDDMSYRVFAMPINGESIDEETLEAIKEEIHALPLGSIRYDSTDTGLKYARFDTTTGRYLYKDEDINEVMAVSNHFDGIIIFSMGVFNKSLNELDAYYAVHGKGATKWDGECVLPIPNNAIGKGNSISSDSFVENPDAPDGVTKVANKYMQIMQYVLYVLIAIGLVWYFFFR